jgi:hypothetical protein
MDISPKGSIWANDPVCWKTENCGGNRAYYCILFLQPRLYVSSGLQDGCISQSFPVTLSLFLSLVFTEMNVEWRHDTLGSQNSLPEDSGLLGLLLHHRVNGSQHSIWMWCLQNTGNPFPNNTDLNSYTETFMIQLTLLYLILAIFSLILLYIIFLLGH